jgi:hypothetical protein
MLPAVIAAAQSDSIAQRYHVMTFGVNYKLGWSPFGVF